MLSFQNTNASGAQDIIGGPTIRSEGGFSAISGGNGLRQPVSTRRVRHSLVRLRCRLNFLKAGSEIYALV